MKRVLRSTLTRRRFACGSAAIVSGGLLGGLLGSLVEKPAGALYQAFADPSADRRGQTEKRGEIEDRLGAARFRWRQADKVLRLLRSRPWTNYSPAPR